MHKIDSKPITIDDFEIDDYQESIWTNDGKFIFELYTAWDKVIETLEELRQTYLETKDKRVWKELIRLLPESYLQTRTVTMSYENLFAMCHQRDNHKLNEWSGKDNITKPNFIAFVKSLPYSEELIFITPLDNKTH